MPSPPVAARERSVCPPIHRDRLWKSSASPYQNRPLGGKAIPHVSIAGAEYAQMMPQGCVGMEVLMNGGLRRYGLRRAGFLLSECLGVFLTAAPALSQPSQSQINAVRQNCRSDYMAHCSSVPPGGAESLNCLQNNSSRLSAGCRGAVDALKPAAAAPAAKPAAAAPPPAPAAAPAPERTAAPVRAPAATAAAPAQEQPRPQTAKPPPSRQAPPPRTALRLPPQRRPNLHGCTCRCRRCCRASNSESSVRAMATGRRCAAWCRSAADA